MHEYDHIPDVRDGLTRLERIILFELHKAQRETGREWIPSVMLYGRVVERIAISEDQLREAMVRLGIHPG